jgi:hypothetical protein
MSMRTVNPLQTRRVVKAMKPRNPVQIALKNNQGAKSAGPHRKKRGALRRAENMAITREIADFR